MLFIFMLGCQQNSEDNVLPKEAKENRFTQVDDPNSDMDQAYKNEDVTTHLANVAADVPNVNDAVAIVAGPYAVVGIDVDAKLDRSRVGTIKYTVSEALQHDPYGKTAVVIADADIMERIRSMKRSIQDGYPVQGVIDELSAIVGRYMPDFPVDENKQRKPDQNKEIISDDEQEELDHIEEDQSEEDQSKE